MNEVFQFGPFRLDTGQRILSAGAREIAIGTKPFDTLHFLVENAGRVITKQELIDRVWPDSHVDENNLAQNISLIRKTLAGFDEKTAYVETLPRRGYRFLGNVTALRQAPGAVVAETPVPKTCYARSGDVNIAYQVLGNGPIDLVFVMGWVSHLEMFWAEPSFARFLRRLAGFSRLILFDKRGTGLSDRVPLSQLPTLEQRMDDVRAVMSAAGSHRAVLVGVSEGGPMCALFAATYPEQTAGVIMIGGYARRLWAPDYPWGPSPEQRESFIAALEREWGGPFGIEARAPSKAKDADFRRWWATYLRMGASPGAAAALTRMNADVDIRHVLPTIRVPSLIIHRTGDRCLLVEEGRYLAERIPGARLVELPGDDHLPFVGDQDSVINAVERFIGELGESEQPARVLATLLFIRTEDESLDDVARREVEWFHGRKFARVTDALVATFDGPARAIRCAQALMAEAQKRGIRFAAGLHTGECDAQGASITGIAVEIGALLAEAAAPGEIVVSNTVRDLVAGSGLRFEERGGTSLGPRLGEWALFRVVS